MLSKLLRNRLRVLSRTRYWSFLAVLFWYVALFPGRIGSDPIQAISLIRKDESTDWWTGMYFWFLRITTFGGQQIWLPSLISLLVLFCSLTYFVLSLPFDKTFLERMLFIICINPLFGNFGVNINHDTFLTAGILILVGVSFQSIRRQLEKRDYLYILIAVFSLMNAKTGYFILLSMLIFLIFRLKKFLVSTLCATFIIFLFFTSNIGIAKSEVPMEILPALADIKCVAQHPQANLSLEDWEYLSEIADKSTWREPKTCSSIDVALSQVQGKGLNGILLLDFAPKYLKIVLKNPAIVIQAHLQRSSPALPPPFFQGPQNQTDRDIMNPVGYKTNIALQLGPEVLHPSIDDPTLDIDKGPLEVLEALALFAGFLINQASWFWGWGGLWLWPIFFFLLSTLRVRKPSDVLSITYPIITNHLLLLLVGPIPAPRYVMSSILVGVVCLTCTIGLRFRNTSKGI